MQYTWPSVSTAPPHPATFNPSCTTRPPVSPCHPVALAGKSCFAPYVGKWAERMRGFAVPMGRDAAVRLQSRERQLAGQYDVLEKRREEASSEARIEEISEDMPTVRAVSRRCEVLEAELFHLRAEHAASVANNAAKMSAILQHHKLDDPSQPKATVRRGSVLNI